MAKIYVTNKSGHDYSDAMRFGDEIVFLSEGRIKNPNAVNDLYRSLAAKLSSSAAEDYIVITSLPVLSALACAIMARKHGRLNLLVFRDGKYSERNISIDELL